MAPTGGQEARNKAARKSIIELHQEATQTEVKRKTTSLRGLRGFHLHFEHHDKGVESDEGNVPPTRVKSFDMTAMTEPPQFSAELRGQSESLLDASGSVEILGSQVGLTTEEQHTREMARSNSSSIDESDRSEAFTESGGSWRKERASSRESCLDQEIRGNRLMIAESFHGMPFKARPPLSERHKFLNRELLELFLEDQTDEFMKTVDRGGERMPNWLVIRE